MKIEEGEKAGSQAPGIKPRTPGLCSQCSVADYDNRTTTSPHNPLYMYCTGGTEMPQLHTRKDREGKHRRRKQISSVEAIQKNLPPRYARRQIFYKCPHLDCKIKPFFNDNSV